MEINPYEVLGVDKDATLEEIKAAYKQKSKENHPDLGGSTEEMQKIIEAYNILSDESRRSYYDKTGSSQMDNTASRVNEIILIEFMKALHEHSDYKVKDLIKVAKGNIYFHITETRKAIRQTKEAIKNTQDIADRVSVKKGLPNFIQSHLLSEIDRLEGHLKMGELDLEALTIAHVEVENFTYRVDASLPGEGHPISFTFRMDSY